MSALALLLHDNGVKVRGSDQKESVFTCTLVQKGISVHIGETQEIWEDTVVYTGAIEKAHFQLTAAKRAGKRLLSRAQLLGEVAEAYPHVLSIAGCHGKTTACCMLSHVLARAQLPFTCHIGGEDREFDNYRAQGNDFFVTEACEFQRSFLTLKSEVGVILNVDFDHTDCYHTQRELIGAYEQFASRAKRVVVCADDVRARKISHTLSFGFHSGDIRAENLRQKGEKYAFTVVERDIPLVRVQLDIVGKVNVLCALAVFAVARLIGLSAEQIKEGLEDFHGVKRRFEEVGTLNGIPVVCDYAHHPKEILASLNTACRLCEGRVHLVFQPHTYTRTRDLMKDFVSVLQRAESCILYQTFSAREPFDFEGSAVALLAKIPQAVYVQSSEQLQTRLRQRISPNDFILVLGAGDIYEYAKEIVDSKTSVY